MAENYIRKQNMEKNLRNGCTAVQGIGIRDIVRIRREKGIPCMKPHMNNAYSKMV